MSAKDLWIAVVFEAVLDIDTEHYRSVEYAQAVSFFCAAGDWADSRQRIADCVGLHTDDLTRLGRQAIAARHLRDGPPPVIVAAAVPIQPPRPEPKPQPIVAPVVSLPKAQSQREKARRTRQAAVAETRDREWWIARFLAKQRIA